jgi:type 1 fimbria pilin
MKLRTTLIALAIASSTGIAPTALAQSADLSISGRIFPGACVVNLGSGGIADLGDIRAEALNAETTTLLEAVNVPLTVACESEVRFAFQGVDNNSDSSSVPYRYGLGLTSADEKIGSANVLVADVTADGVPGFGTLSGDGGETWNDSNAGGNFSLTLTDVLGFAKEQGTAAGPAAIKDTQGSVKVIAQIQPTNELTLTEEIQVNGSVTINLMYL